MNHRKHESPRTWLRSDRIYRSSSKWYFHTREGIDVGPFNSEFEAQVEASILKNVLKQKPAEIARDAIYEYVRDAANSGFDQ